MNVSSSFFLWPCSLCIDNLTFICLNGSELEIGHASVQERHGRKIPTPTMPELEGSRLGVGSGYRSRVSGLFSGWAHSRSTLSWAWVGIASRAQRRPSPRTAMFDIIFAANWDSWLVPWLASWSLSRALDGCLDRISRLQANFKFFSRTNRLYQMVTPEEGRKS